MKRKILRTALLTTLGTALVFTILVSILMMHIFTGQTRRELEQNVRQIGLALSRDEDPAGYLSALSRADFPLRVTLINPDGSVAFESDSDSALMDNHLDRDEIQQAKTIGFGESTRYSPTLREQTYYAALLLEDGSFLRLSETQDSVLGLMLNLLKYLIPAMLAVCAAASGISVLLTRKIVAPINSLNLDAPERSSIYPELQPLLRRMTAQNRSIQEYIRTLNARRNEFDTITANMAEGLILMNTAGSVLMINRSAQRIFRTESAEGESILRLSQNEDFTRTFRAALQGRHAEGMLQIDSRYYRLLVNPVYDSGHFTGLVALIPDITDHFLAEQNRREFTANVSHELKTPLTSIVGCAEIMQSGIAAQEDWQGLVECIYKEGSRMIRLVEDILHLSKLDSGALHGEPEEIDLLSLAREIARRFSPAAQKRGVSIEVSGDETRLAAQRQMADEILSNLVDNAVKYNREGGSVQVHVHRDGECAALSVRDSGIGIAPEHQQRIFERFYRVDKSRSKATGGTGLGLSIVKHAVQILGGTVQLHSSPGEGTEITVRLPDSPPPPSSPE